MCFANSVISFGAEGSSDDGSVTSIDAVDVILSGSMIDFVITGESVIRVTLAGSTVNGSTISLRTTFSSFNSLLFDGC